MTKYFALFAAFLLATAFAARADHVGIDLSSVSPAGASTTTVGYTGLTDIGLFNTCSFYVVATGATGGALDIFVQTAVKRLNASPRWVDAAHLPQIAAGAAATAYVFTLTRWSPTTAAITTGMNTASATPLLPANTVVPGLLGYLLRVVYKTGVGNTVGAPQEITAYCSGS